MSRVLLCIALLVCVSSASAQIIYEPVQSQYRGCDGVTYYYGGSNPVIHQFAGIRLDGHRVVESQPLQVFTDRTGLINAALLGYTADDARNDAYAAVPRYFAKRDLLNAAVRQDGVWVVPAQAQPVRISKSNGTQVVPAPAAMPRPLMIIPKDMLLKPQLNKSDKQVVIAD